MKTEITKVSDHIIFLPFYSKLTENEKTFLERNSVIRKYNKNEILYETNDEWHGMMYQISGSMKIFITSREGRNINLFRIEHNETYVFSASCVERKIPLQTSIRVEEPSEILIINPSAASKLINENIYVRCFIYEHSTVNFSNVMMTMEQIIFSSVEERLSLFLIKEYNKLGSNEIRMTHEQIAEQINSVREVTARMLKKFSEQGIVSLKRNTVKIEKPEELAFMAGKYPA